MKKTSYIFFILWLSTVVLSNALKICNSFCDDSSIELTEKESKEKSADDSDDETEKEPKKDAEKEFFYHRNWLVLSANSMSALSAQTHIPSHDDDCLSSLYVFLPKNPPKA